MYQTLRRFLRQAFERSLDAIPTGLRWRQTQAAYQNWVHHKLPPKYMAFIVKQGHMFADFVGEPGPLVDVGCGNGLIGGVPVAKTDYAPLRRGQYPILGIDPLPLEAPIPWISKFKQMRCEDYAEPGYHAAAFVTSFDHLRDPEICLTRLHLYGVKQLYIWETLYKKPERGGWHHVKRYTYNELDRLLYEMGYAITKSRVVDKSEGAEGWFIQASA